jgi:beta-glucosidase
VINYVDEDVTENSDDVEYYEINDGTVVDLSTVKTGKGATCFLGFDVIYSGCYFIDMIGSSDLSELSQIPVGVFFQGVPCGSFTFHGGGEELTIRRKIWFHSKYGVMRLKFMNGGLKLKEIRFTFEREQDTWDGFDDIDEYIY